MPQIASPDMGVDPVDPHSYLPRYSCVLSSSYPLSSFLNFRSFASTYLL